MLIEKRNETIFYWSDYLKKGKITPFFQPILSLEKKCLFGYEALGRMIIDNKIHSIGEFFLLGLENEKESKSNEHIRFIEMQNMIDRKLREEAIHKLALDPNPESKLFLNISPTTMMSYIEKIRDGKLPTPHTIDKVKELGIKPNRIVIEITEAYIEKNLEFLSPLIDLYKDFGFLIAIDDLGSKSSNLDRIGIFKPDIIKVDMQFLRKSMLERSYKEILFTISHLSESLGISLLFEGVETFEELNQAMSFGARYLQGYLFSKAEKDLIEKDKFTEKINFYISEFHQLKVNEIKQKIQWEESIEAKILNLLDEIEINENGEIISYSKIFEADSRIFKFYITDFHGNQSSPNYLKNNLNQTEVHLENILNSNWTWRPYFLNHLYQSSKNQNGLVISQPYNDIEKKVLLRTFSKTFKGNLIFFIDILYEE